MFVAGVDTRNFSTFSAGSLRETLNLAFKSNDRKVQCYFLLADAGMEATAGFFWLLVFFALC